jgi:RNA polymerase sigma factor (TIGR02999 family)
MLNAMSDVTHILSMIESGDQQASEELLPLVYSELRKLASARMVQERPDHTLQGTALVHEAYVRLVDVDQAQHWDSRGHFFSAAAEAMRRILVESARRKGRLKHGGEHQREPLDEAAEIALPLPSDKLIALHEALESMEAEDPQTAQLVKLRFFAGFSMSQVAEVLGRPLRSVELEWTYARSWLFRELSTGDSSVA